LLETAQEVFTYLQGGVIVALAIAFLAGLAAVKTVAYERRSRLVFFLLVGILGLFLGEFMLGYLNFDEYLENVAELRILIDFIAAYLGSFFIAAIVHFIKPA
jgi:uncharacterized membrane protein YeaQ/YmgE (transglycosylase-associated protein family)